MYDGDILNASHGDVVAFARVMREVGADGFDDPSVVIDYFQTPWKWAREFELWTVLDRPGEDDTGWATFVDLVLAGEPTIRLFLIEQEEKEPA